MRPIRALVRILLFLFLSLATIVRMLLGLGWLRVIRATQNDTRQWIHKRFVRFVRRVQRIMGLHVSWEGQFPDHPAVPMGNRSYVDAVLFPVGFPWCTSGESNPNRGLSLDGELRCLAPFG